MVLLVCSSLTSLIGQEFSMDLMQDIKPRNIGPAGMSGRVTAIDVQLTNPDVMYVGTASGGLWKSTSGGIKWEPIFDKEVTASIGAVAIQQSNPSVIWAGTGEGNPRNSLNGGYGIYKSIDGGKNWMAMGLKRLGIFTVFLLTLPTQMLFMWVLLVRLGENILNVVYLKPRMAVNLGRKSFL